AQVIGVLGCAGAGAALLPLTEDHDHDVAQAATRALQQLKMSRP
ncbi:MAG: hypothetical protein V7647_334, partial [Acidobacteriota bacterium]